LHVTRAADLGMTAAVALACAGVLALGLAGWLLRSIGTPWRVARLLAAAPELPIADVVAVADARPVRYVRTRGRINSDEEFPDEAQRPLVFRRIRVQRLAGRALDGGRRWQTLYERRLAVPFRVEERGAQVGVDGDALGDGLVVIPRESEGVAGDLPDDLAASLEARLAPETPVRLRIDQVSAVEHAMVAGMPVRAADGKVTLTAGTGRPLIVSTVEPAAAMRLLAAGHRRTAMTAAVLLVAGLGLLAVALVLLLASA
jgi:hypothetical protein